MATYYIPNGPTIPSMTELKSTSDRHGGLAKSAKFMVRISPQRTDNYLKSSSAFMKDLSYLCEAAEFPGRGFTATDIRYYGPNFKVPTQTSYEDLNLTFLCRDAFFERQFFDTWMELINPNATYNFSYRDDYTARIELFQISDIDGDSRTRAQYKFTFVSAYPVLLNPQPVTWADDNYHRLTVTFTYIKWWREDGDFKLNSDFTLVNGREISGSENNGIITPRFNAG